MKQLKMSIVTYVSIETTYENIHIDDDTDHQI